MTAGGRAGRDLPAPIEREAQPARENIVDPAEGRAEVFDPDRDPSGHGEKDATASGGCAAAVRRDEQAMLDEYERERGRRR